MEVFGYKCFDKDLTNIYGNKFEIGKQYTVNGEIKFGVNGNGFHFCKNIEDTFRFFNTNEKDICVCEVIGSGNFVVRNDEYNGYFDMYCSEKLTIVKQLNRIDIINKGLELPTPNVIRFISTVMLTAEEIELFKIKFKNDKQVLRAIAYYQEGDTEIYNREFKIKK